MAHSIELLFDEDTETAIGAIWTALAAADLPGRARTTSPTNRPHATMVVAERIDAAVDGPLAQVAAQLPIPCIVGAPLLFGADRPVLARLIVPSVALLAAQQDAYRLALPYLSPGPLPHTAPDTWTPHVTLARRIHADRLGAALRIGGRGELAGRFVAVRRWDSDAGTDRLIS